MLEVRVKRLQTLMVNKNLDYTVIMPGPNMHYFTDLDFHLSERPILALFPQKGEPALIVPGFESFKATEGANALPWQLFTWSDETGPELAFAACAEALQLSGKQVGAETLGLRLKEYQLLTTHAPTIDIVSADSLIATMRQIKDAEEIARMRRAVVMAEETLAEVLPKIKVGMTEKAVAAELMVALLKAGSGPLPFEPLVQTGATGATPHAHSSDRQLAEGDLLIIDFGATFKGYASDITRTFAVGEISERAKEVYNLVKQANAAGRQAAKPSITCQAIDRATRTVIDEGDHGEYFIHRTGHGLGLEAHEPPFIVEGDKTILEPGMTFTVEPGIYMQGVGGVRIEDDVVITDTGVESLTTFSRDLITVG
ncbi:MAG: Xaa-Pro peptidase family protein [Chloroflexota bacterium]